VVRADLTEAIDLIPPLTAPDFNRRRSERATALLVVLAIGLVVLAVIVVPLPRVRLTSARYETTACDPVTISFVARAIVTLTNEGNGDGAIVVQFYVDGLLRAKGTYLVSAQSTIQRTLDTVIAGCSSHRYSVDTCIPASSRSSVADC